MANPISQIMVDRIAGIVTAANSMGGTHKASQIKCIETNALVGGSQPHAPQRPLMCGIFTLPSAVAPKIEIAIATARNISFLNMTLQSNYGTNYGTRDNAAIVSRFSTVFFFATGKVNCPTLRYDLMRFTYAATSLMYADWVRVYEKGK